MGEAGFEQAYAAYLEKQRREAIGMRAEMLFKELIGTKRLLEMLWPVIGGSLEEIVLEYEMTSLTGVKLYA
ncbi:MAG: hypothetical protein J7559_17005, partial [Cohnella sp.]|nr:hypothetical protein [Cohnella sp.]